MVEKRIHNKLYKRISPLWVTILVVLLLVGGVVLYFSNLGNLRTQKAKEAGLIYAKQQCYKTQKTGNLCDSLYAESENPSWGPDWWTVDIYSTSDKNFSASARVEFKNNKPIVLDYTINN